MRALVRFDTGLQVEEFIEMEHYRSNGNIALWMPEHMRSIVITANVSNYKYEELAMKLLRDGYIDLKEYHARYMNDNEEGTDDDESLYDTSDFADYV